MQILKLVLLLALTVLTASLSRADWNPLFFELKRENQVIYLLGTRHIGVSLKSAPPLIIAKLRQSNSIFLESTDDGSFKLETAGAATLGDVLDLTALRALRKKLGWSHVSIAELKLFPPAEIIGLLMAQPEKFEKEAGMGMLDHEIHQWAVSHGKPVGSLDDGLANDPMKRLFEPNRTRAFLFELIFPNKDFDIQSSDLEDFLKGNLSQFEEALAKLRIAQSELSRLIYDEFLLSRNSHWVKSLDKLKGTGSVFVAVGAMHLVGEEGLLNMLTKQGYSIQRIEFSGKRSLCSSIF